MYIYNSANLILATSSLPASLLPTRFNSVPLLFLSFFLFLFMLIFPIPLSVSVSICLFVYLSVSVSVSVSLSIYISDNAYAYIYLSIYLSIYLWRQICRSSKLTSTTKINQPLFVLIAIHFLLHFFELFIYVMIFRDEHDSVSSSIYTWEHLAADSRK